MTSGSEPNGREEPTGTVRSPDGAVYAVEQDLLDAARPNGRLEATVHERDGSSYCNIWLRDSAGWHRLLPEKVVPWAPTTDMLSGECYRLATNPELGPKFQADDRLALALGSIDQMARHYHDKP